MEGFVTTREAREKLGVADITLRRWADNNLIPSIRSPGGHRLYSVDKFLNAKDIRLESLEKERYCYCRVSSISQKDDLERQVKSMRQSFPKHKIITDIGSGINFKRKGLRSLIEMAAKGQIEEVVVAYRDRLCRIAFELVQWFFSINEVKLLVLNQEMDSSSENSELAEDLLSIVTIFSCKINGRRKYRTKGQQMQNNQVEASS